MDTDVFGTYYQGDAGYPVLPVTPETYATNADGTVTGTVTANVTVGLSVSEPLANDVTVYFESGILQDGHPCDGPCPVPSYPCTLTMGQTQTTCQIPNWWQSYWSGAPDLGGFGYNLIYTDTGQPNLATVNGHPNTYGFGFTIIPAFVPISASGGTLARAVRPAPATSGKSFTIRYDPIFAGNFTLYAKRYGVVVSTKFLGWEAPGPHAARFYCGVRHGALTLVVVGGRRGTTQRSQTKSVYC